MRLGSNTRKLTGRGLSPVVVITGMTVVALNLAVMPASASVGAIPAVTTALSSPIPCKLRWGW